MAAVSHRQLPDAASLPCRHPRPRDGTRDRDRVRARHGLHDAAPGAGSRRPVGPWHARGRVHALGASPPLRLRARRSVAPSGTTKRHGGRGAGCGGSSDRRPARRRDRQRHVGLPRRCRGSGRVHDDLAPFVRAAAAADRSVGRAQEHDPVLDRLDGAVHVPGRMAGGGQPVAPHPQGALLPADRRDRRRADDVAAGGDRWRAQLGLPVLLAPRRHVHPVRDADGRLRG